MEGRAGAAYRSLANVWCLDQAVGGKLRWMKSHMKLEEKNPSCVLPTGFYYNPISTRRAQLDV